MDLGLAGRVFDVIGGSDGIGGTCSAALTAEGAVAGTDDVDIVIAHGDARPGSSLLECATAEELHQAWDAMVRAVDRYRSAFPAMASRRWGRFVWVGSAQARAVDADTDELDAVVTLAMMGLHKVVTAEEGPSNITANVVLRGGDATDDDVAATVAYLCSEDAGYLSGVTITVDGGAGSAVF
jgi:NAD(P)-dependent dehydrogenase (short-subunit alcohol dehydrogenase family)